MQSRGHPFPHGQPDSQIAVNVGTFAVHPVGIGAYVGINPFDIRRKGEIGRVVGECFVNILAKREAREGREFRQTDRHGKFGFAFLEVAHSDGFLIAFVTGVIQFEREARAKPVTCQHVCPHPFRIFGTEEQVPEGGNRSVEKRDFLAVGNGREVFHAAAYREVSVDAVFGFRFGKVRFFVVENTSGFHVVFPFAFGKKVKGDIDVLPLNAFFAVGPVKLEHHFR